MNRVAPPDTMPTVMWIALRVAARVAVGLFLVALALSAHGQVWHPDLDCDVGPAGGCMCVVTADAGTGL